MTIEYKHFNDNLIIVNCDKKKYEDLLTPLGSKKCKSGFLIPSEKENQLLKIIQLINNNKLKYKKSDPKYYYKSFNSKPLDFKQINNINIDDEEEDDDSNYYSSSSNHSSSTDNFPSPATPHKKINSNKDFEEIYLSIQNIDKRIKLLESKFLK
jgi:hypothetical protein